MALDWDKLRLFHAVTEAGSFTEAAKKLNLTQPVLSRHIRTLEESLDTILFHRHARGLVLTADGERLFAAIGGFASRIESTARDIAVGNKVARGPLSVTTTVAFGSMWLAPHLPGFYKRFPDMRLNLLLSDEDLNLSKREAEVAISFRPPVLADLIQRPLLRVNQHIYASQGYIEEHGAPQHVDDLDRHTLITYGDNVPLPIKDVNWVLRLGRTDTPREPLLTINNIHGVTQAVRAGLGIAALPDYSADKYPELLRILPEINGPRFQTYFVYPSELRGSKRVLALRDYLLEEVAATGGAI